MKMSNLHRKRERQYNKTLILGLSVPLIAKYALALTELITTLGTLLNCRFRVGTRRRINDEETVCKPRASKTDSLSS